MKPINFVALLLCASAVAQQLAAPDNDAAQVRFLTIKSIADVVPSTVKLRIEGKSNPDGVQQANDAVTAKALDRRARLFLKVQVFEPFTEWGGWGYRIMAEDGHVAMGTDTIPYRIWAYFRPDQYESLANVTKGSVLMLSGSLGRADVKVYGGKPCLSLDLHDAKVETP